MPGQQPTKGPTKGYGSTAKSRLPGQFERFGQLAAVIAVVQRQAPGTWLPIKVKRGGETLDLVAKFPPAAP